MKGFVFGDLDLDVGFLLGLALVHAFCHDPSGALVLCCQSLAGEKLVPGGVHSLLLLRPRSSADHPWSLLFSADRSLLLSTLF